MNLKDFVLIFAISMGTFLTSCNTKQENNSEIIEEQPTSDALPEGMKMVWNDEFNGTELDTSKWWDRYFSSLDWFNNDALEAFENGQLPPADYEFTGNSIILRATDNYYPGANRQISSIQTYNWENNTNMMDNAIGGFFETRIRRDIGENGDRVNLAFWFDSPGPDLKYYLEEGGEAHNTKGIRPRGQLFEIDLCEYITTEIVLHGNVDKNGKFERNIGHYIHKGDFKGKWVTHSMLWSPAGLKFYIDGELIKEWWDPNDIKSPNHAMNMFFGAYGVDDVSMEIDYVRYYQWELEGDNLMPNGNFEYSDKLFPWEGLGAITKDSAYDGAQAVVIDSKKDIEQYVYLEPNSDYQLTLWAKGDGEIKIDADNIKSVVGTSESNFQASHRVSDEYKQYSLSLSTLDEHEGNMRTVKVSIANIGDGAVVVDKVELIKK